MKCRRRHRRRRRRLNEAEDQPTLFSSYFRGILQNNFQIRKKEEDLFHIDEEELKLKFLNEYSQSLDQIILKLRVSNAWIGYTAAKIYNNKNVGAISRSPKMYS